LSSGAPAGVQQGHHYTTTKFQLLFGAFGSYAPFIGTTSSFFSEGKGNRISPSRPFRGGEKPRPSPLSIGTPPQGRPARRVPQGDGGAPGLAAAQGRGWSAGHCGACGCPACSPAFLLTTSYEPHIDGMILAMREGRYLSTAAFLYLRALCRALGSGPLAR